MYRQTMRVHTRGAMLWIRLILNNFLALMEIDAWDGCVDVGRRFWLRIKSNSEGIPTRINAPFQLLNYGRVASKQRIYDSRRFLLYLNMKFFRVFVNFSGRLFELRKFCFLFLFAASLQSSRTSRVIRRIGRRLAFFIEHSHILVLLSFTITGTMRKPEASRASKPNRMRWRLIGLSMWKREIQSE